uniref:LEF-4 n=1 Tax=Faxonius propinquus nudivirus TaxID=3139431 RepID=A0AAU8GD77_9VIRU
MDGNASADTANEEYESSVILPLTKELYCNILKNFPNTNRESIFYYNNGIRKAHNKIQYKNIKKKKNVLKFMYFNDSVLFLPVVRKFSYEYSMELPQDISTIETVIVRNILYDLNDEKFKLRLAVECIQDSKGIKYQFTSEIEYDKIIFHRHLLLIEIETLLFNSIRKYVGEYIKNIASSSIFFFENPENIVNVPSRVFGDFLKYSKKGREVKTFKFDGYKGRFYSTENSIYFYDDLHNIKKESNNSFFHFAKYILFQVEILHPVENEQRVMIITDVLGGYIGSIINPNLYMPEPIDVQEFFLYINNNNIFKKNVFFNFSSFGQFKIITQFPITPNTPTPTWPFDGYIIHKETNIYKYKIPTIDARIVFGYLQLDSSCDAISSQYFPTLTHDSIYEISPMPQRNNNLKNEIEYKILRKRSRNWTSTQEEYQNFLLFVDYLRKQMN